MFFSGYTAGVRAVNRVSSPTNLTICGWFYLRTVQYDLKALEVGSTSGGLGNLGIRFNATTDRWVAHCQGFDQDISAGTLHQWVFLAIVKSGSTVTAFINDQQVSTTHNYTGNGPDLLIGNLFIGEITSVKYWEAALTHDQLLWEKERSLPFYPADGYYPLISDVDGLEGTFDPGPTPDTATFIAFDWLPEAQVPFEIFAATQEVASPLFPPIAEAVRILPSGSSSFGVAFASAQACVVKMATASSTAVSATVLNARRIAGVQLTAQAAAFATANATGRFLLALSSNGSTVATANVIGQFGLAGSSSGTAFATHGHINVVRTEASEIMLQKERIHNRLIDIANSAVFYGAVIDPQTNRMAIDETKPIKPAKVTVMETISYWQRARFFKRWLSDERAGWTWVMTMTFTNHHAVLERFEELVSDRPINIPADPQNGLRSVIVRLVSSEYTHPPEQSPNRGSVVAVTFEATVSRK